MPACRARLTSEAYAILGVCAAEYLGGARGLRTGAEDRSVLSAKHRDTRVSHGRTLETNLSVQTLGIRFRNDSSLVFELRSLK